MKRAIITGASGDIGAAICKRLAQQQFAVIAHANSNPEKAGQLVEEINHQGGTAQTVMFDIRDSEQTTKQLKTLLEQGPIQVVIHNAGIHQDAPLAGMSTAAWHDVVDVSLNGFYHLTQPLLLPMIGTRWGRIIAMSSVAGIMGNRGQCNYSAAKAGLHGACKSLAQELASRGITVNTVAPGIIQGEMTQNSFDKQQIKAMVPMQRAGYPKEVAALVAFLCSEEAAYISGQIIGVNGAMA